MQTIKKFIFAVFMATTFIVAGMQANAQIPDEIILSFKNGNSKTLADYFNQNIELVVLEDDNVYSKAQAQQIVAKFFGNNKPESFTVIHQGGKEDAKYVIGNLKTNNGIFRIYFLLKTSAQKNYIHQLRIEKQ